MKTVKINCRGTEVIGHVLVKSSKVWLIGFIYNNKPNLRLYPNHYFEDGKGQHRTINPVTKRGLAPWFSRSYYLMSGRELNYTNLKAHLIFLNRQASIKKKDYLPTPNQYQCQSSFRCYDYRVMAMLLDAAVKEKFVYCPFCGGTIGTLPKDADGKPIPYIDKEKGKIMEPEFKIEDIVGSLTGILIGDMGDMHSVYEHLFAKAVFTHELPVLFEHVKKAITDLYPDLEKELELISEVSGKPENIPFYVDRLRQDYGPTRPLPVRISLQGIDTHAALRGRPVISVVVP